MLSASQGAVFVIGILRHLTKKVGLQSMLLQCRTLHMKVNRNVRSTRAAFYSVLMRSFYGLYRLYHTNMNFIFAIAKRSGAAACGLGMLVDVVFVCMFISMSECLHIPTTLPLY